MGDQRVTILDDSGDRAEVLVPVIDLVVGSLRRSERLRLPGGCQPLNTELEPLEADVRLGDPAHFEVHLTAYVSELCGDDEEARLFAVSQDEQYVHLADLLLGDVELVFLADPPADIDPPADQMVQVTITLKGMGA